MKSSNVGEFHADFSSILMNEEEIASPEGKKRKLEIIDEISNSKMRKHNDSESLIPFHLQDVFLENVLPFMRGGDLNLIRFVCRCWYTFQRSDYFVSNHVQRLKLEHDVLNISKKITQLSIVRIYLGNKQGNMLIIHIGKDDVFSEEIIEEHIRDPNCTRHVDDSLVSKFNTSQIKSIVGYRDGKKHGKTVDYFKTGDVMQIGHFENGKKNGEFIKYFSNPYALERTCSYKNDKLHGKLVENKIVYDSRNQKVLVKDIECSYENGKYHGEKIVFAGSDSKIVDISNYKNGKLHGLSKVFKYSKGDGPSDYFLQSEGNYKDGKAHGTCKSFYADGSPFEIKEYKDGQLLSQTINRTKRRRSSQSTEECDLESSEDSEDLEEKL